MYSWIYILSIFIAFTETTCHEYEDNDFAEFEVFEDEEAVPSEKIEVQEAVQKNEPIEEEKPKIYEKNDYDEEEITVEDEIDADEFSHFADEEEFTGYTNGDGSDGHASSKIKEEPKITIAKVPLHLRSNWDSFYLEMLMIAGLVVYFANFIMGKNKNQKLANAWFNSHKTLLMQNFALVGDSGKKDSIEDGGLIKESENVYTLWCSGRVCIEGMQDLIGVITQLVRPGSDQLIIKIFVDDMDSFVFAFATKKTASKLVKDMADISTFCPEKKSADKFGVWSHFFVMSELGEVSMAILGDPKVIAVLNKYSSLIEYLHFSDQYSGLKQQDDTQPMKLPDVKKTLIFGFNFPGKGNPSFEEIESMKILLQLVFHLVDKLKKFKLSKEGKVKAEKNRTRVEEAFLKATHSARAELAQSMREKKRRAERERIMEMDDPEKQKKWEEKEQRREMKKRAPKMKQIKIKAM